MIIQTHSYQSIYPFLASNIALQLILNHKGWTTEQAETRTSPLFGREYNKPPQAQIA